LFFLNKLNDWDGKAKAWAWMGGIYANLGNYDSSYFYCSESLRIRQQMSDHSCVAYSFANMGHLYKIAGSNEDALYYYRLAFNYANTHAVDYYVTSLIYLEPIGNIYKALNRVDSSYYYLQRAIEVDPDNKMKKISFGETLLKKGEIDSALLIFSKPIKHFREQNDKWDLMRVLLNVAKVYQAKKADSEALQYALESLSIAKQADAKQNILEAYKLLLALYNNLDKRDSAYFFLEKYTALKDSLVNTQFLWKLSNYKKQEDFKRQLEELAFLDKENKIKEEKLHQEAKLKWILLAGLLITALSGFMIYKNLVLKRKHDKLESRHRQTELQHHITELEMQALRAQMSPHFIFNCLNSINRFILKNEMEAASNYLTKFSRLIRMVLTHSKKTFISLEDELEMLRLYLDMERLRFKDAFEYSIIFKNSVDVGNVFVPPLLLQPFAENAIWHGLMHKDGNGHLEIELSIDKKVLNCTITDDGVGRSKAAEIKSNSVEKQKSMGLKITADRLALLNKDNEQPTSFNVEDIIDNEGKPAGTRVILKMNYKNLIEVTS
jgi:tetratricopeptide (TPR) repeat protein